MDIGLRECITGFSRKHHMAPTRCGGVVLLGFDGPFIKFQPLRAVYDRQLAFVAWLATEGRGDEAARS
jgi:hypothetical protein